MKYVYTAFGEGLREFDTDTGVDKKLPRIGGAVFASVEMDDQDDSPDPNDGDHIE